MASFFDRTSKALSVIGRMDNLEDLLRRIKNKRTDDLEKERLPIDFKATKESVQKRLEYLRERTQKELYYLSGQKPFDELEQVDGNIENFVGMTMVPTGVIGPMRVIGSAAQGDFYVPLATSEGALVASYHRGAKACYLAGGATSICLVEGLQRSPVFKFENLADLGLFVIWILEQAEVFKSITNQTSRYAQLQDLKTNIEGNHVILTFDYTTGDASGQNMVTLCTDAICQYIIQKAPIQPVFWFVEGNYSGDKKATALSFTNVRGKKVTAEIVLPETVVQSVLKTTSEAMAEYWRSSTMGVIQSGSIGAQGHYANGLTALFMATGQDVACVAEAAIGVTRMEKQSDGSLYASVTLPNLIVGSVGGGTSLPSQKECLELMGCYGSGNARKLAEISGALVLCGELSIAAALSAGHFSNAHKKFGRKKDVS